MGKWRWEGVDALDKKARGEIIAKSESEARRLLRLDGVRVKKLTPPSIFEFDINEWLIEKGLARTFSNKELCLFTKQLSIMINAGIPILQCFDILYKSQKNFSLKTALRSVSQTVGEGKSVAESLSKHRGFSKLYCNLVKAGESGGILDTVLKKLAEHLDAQEKIKSKVKSAMMYPSIVVLVGIVVVWALMVFVVPQFMEMLKDTGQEPPWITQMVVDVSTFLQNYSLYLVPGFVMIVVFINSWRKSSTGKPIWDRFVMKIPVFGGIAVKGALTSFTRTLSTMLSSGVALIESLDICIGTLDHIVLETDLKKARKQVTEGKTFAEPLSRIGYIPAMVTQMVKVGEQTGQLDEMLVRVADIFEEELQNLIENATKMIEPLIIVVLGGIIGAVLIAMYLPIFMSAGGGDTMM